MAEVVVGKPLCLCLPSAFIFGLDAARSVGDRVRQLSGTKVLLVTDPNLIETDVIKPIIESLDTQKISYSLFDGSEPGPPAFLVDEAAEKFDLEGCDLVVGLGGASSLDMAKGVSLVAANRAKTLDMCHANRIIKRGVPKILISTTYNPRSLFGPYVLIHASKEDRTLFPIVSEFATPDVAVMDPLLNVSVPQMVTVDSGINALATAIVAYITLNANPLSDIFAEQAIQMAGQYLPTVRAKGTNLTARYWMSVAAMLSGLAFATVGVGTLDLLCYSVGSAYNLNHGRSLGALLPHAMRHNLTSNPERYASIATLMGKDTEGLSEVHAAELAVEAIQELLEALEIPYRLRDYGASEEDASRLAQQAMGLAKYFFYNREDCNEDTIRSICEAAY